GRVHHDRLSARLQDRNGPCRRLCERHHGDQKIHEIRMTDAPLQRLHAAHGGTDHGDQVLDAVIGPSMGGMQTLQWGVSHPDFMDFLVAMVPLAKTPAWTVAVLEASRKAIMMDPA